MKVINLYQKENEIIQQAVENNRHAQQQIYLKFSPKMLSVCRQYVKDIPLAEDIMITAFMKVFLNLSRFEKKGSFEGWIRRIMVNECISFLRTQKKVPFIDFENYKETPTIFFETEFSVEEIQQLIDNLPDGYKMVFNLYAIEGFKHHEIAKMLSIDEGTSKSQLSHARKLLKEQLLKMKNIQNGTK